MTDLADEMHRHSVERAFPKIGEVDTTSAILAKLK
jgi:hypothetical protein